MSLRNINFAQFLAGDLASALVLQSRLWSRGLKASPVMTLHGTGLVAPSPA